MGVVSVVVVPARNEQDKIGACLSALAQQTISPEAFETILVADACEDRTEAVARATAPAHGLTLTVLEGPGGGSGPRAGSGWTRPPAGSHPSAWPAG